MFASSEPDMGAVPRLWSLKKNEEAAWKFVEMLQKLWSTEFKGLANETSFDKATREFLFVLTFMSADVMIKELDLEFLKTLTAVSKFTDIGVKEIRHLVEHVDVGRVTKELIKGGLTKGKTTFSCRDILRDDFESLREAWMLTGYQPIFPSSEHLHEYLEANAGACLIMEINEDVIGFVIAGTDGVFGYIKQLVMVVDISVAAAMLVMESARVMRDAGCLTVEAMVSVKQQPFFKDMRAKLVGTSRII